MRENHQVILCLTYREELVAEEGMLSKKTWLGGLLLFILGLVSSSGPGREIGDQVVRQGVDLVVVRMKVLCNGQSE
jgi:hypothetical protein